MNALPPRQLSQAQRNASEYNVTNALNEIRHGADADALVSRGYTPDEIKTAFARIDDTRERMIKAGPDAVRRANAFVSQFEPEGGV